MYGRRPAWPRTGFAQDLPRHCRWRNRPDRDWAGAAERNSDKSGRKDLSGRRSLPRNRLERRSRFQLLTAEQLMSNTIRHYTDDKIDISYDARRCIHAAECVHGLPVVFDTGRRPWILPNAANSDAIAAVITKCPTGALHYTRRDGGAETPSEEASIVPMRDGPLYVRGCVQL